MTLFKLVASSSGEKVANYSEQCSRRVSSVVGAYRNPWTLMLQDLASAVIRKMNICINHKSFGWYNIIYERRITCHFNVEQ